MCSVARRHGIAQGLLSTWRRQARQGRLGGDEQAPVFVPVTITPEPSPVLPALPSNAPGAAAQRRRARRLRPVSGWRPATPTCARASPVWA
ncbi:transposase [Methylobacterium sp. W2]|uniref:transposase n=1 Tax=Methylobacterium sp. W2 TaxID=2598107 RepID=UPI001D0C0B8D|nr:transposase [Methylobacterium sp. W2]